MRLLSLNSYHYRRGGSDAVYFSTSEMFQAEGWDTAFHSMKHPKNDASEWEQYFAEEIEYGFDYSIPKKVLLASRAIYNFEAQRKLSRLLDDHAVDVAHAHCIYHHLSPSVLRVLKKRRIPVVLTAHELKTVCPAYKMLNSNGICEECKAGSYLPLLRNKCIKNSRLASAVVYLEATLQKTMNTYRSCVDRVICPSKFYLEKLVEWGWNRQQLVYIPNFFDTPNPLQVSPVGDFFLYFGRLSEEKGVATLIAAASKAGIKLKIVGTGPLDTELKAMAKGNPSIEFLGYRSGADLWNLVAGCRAVVLPSEWYENAPMSVLEGYSFGKPLIGSRIGGIPELVVEGETGYCFESGNVDELTERLSELQAMSNERLLEFGAACNQFVSERFSKRRYFESIQKLYLELIAANRT